jgi:integrase
MYLKHSEAYNSQAWFKAKKYIADRYFNQFLDRKITDITRIELEQHFIERKAKSVRSSNLDFEILRNFFHWCIENEMIEKSPMRFMKKFPKPQSVRVIPRKEEVDALLQSVQGQDRLLFLLLVHTLGRISEIMGLQWTDVNLEKKVLYLKTRKTKDGSEKIREIPINGALFSMLSSGQDRSGFVLQSKDGQQYQDLRKRLKRCLSEAQVSMNGFHSLRHYGISRLIEQGVDPAVVRDLAGHSTLSMTNHYSHTSAETRRAAIEKLS